MNWFLGFLLTLSLAINVLLALVLADIRAEANAKRAANNDELDAELLRIVNGRRSDGT